MVDEKKKSSKLEVYDSEVKDKTEKKEDSKENKEITESENKGSSEAKEAEQKEIIKEAANDSLKLSKTKLWQYTAIFFFITTVLLLVFPINLFGSESFGGKGSVVNLESGDEAESNADSGTIKKKTMKIKIMN